MSKLSHIEDVEQRNAEAQAEEQEVMQAQNAVQTQQTQQSQSAVQETKPAKHSEFPPLDEDLTAEEEEEFHGLDAKQPMSTGHKMLIILAVVIVIIAILYIVNSWIHIF